MKTQALVWVLQSTARRHAPTALCHYLAMVIGSAGSPQRGSGDDWALDGLDRSVGLPGALQPGHTRTSRGVCIGSSSWVSLSLASLDRGPWPPGSMSQLRSGPIWMTCHWFGHHAVVNGIPVLTCQLHQGLIARCGLNGTVASQLLRGAAAELLSGCIQLDPTPTSRPWLHRQRRGMMRHASISLCHPHAPLRLPAEPRRPGAAVPGIHPCRDRQANGLCRCGRCHCS